jgi:hypothetical protein
MEICEVGVELYHAGGRTERQNEALRDFRTRLKTIAVGCATHFVLNGVKTSALQIVFSGNYGKLVHQFTVTVESLKFFRDFLIIFFNASINCFRAWQYTMAVTGTSSESFH